MTEPAGSDRRWRFRSALRAEWSEIGVFGRIAFGGVVVSLVVAVILGVWIPTLVRHHLLASRAGLMRTIGNDIAEQGLVPVGPPGSSSYRRLAEVVEQSLIGGETVRVKLWTVDGTIAYSDDQSLVGLDFDLTPAALDALAGTSSFAMADLSEPAHANERYLGRLMEFYVPVHDTTGQTIGLFEVEQATDTLDATLTRVRTNVWLAIGSGIVILGIFMASLTVAAARVLNRRRRQAEHLLGSLFRAQEEERRRTVGALHDDVGQPLYRLLYGIEGARNRLPDGDPVRAELGTLGDLTRDIERTLRTELRLLHHGVEQELDLVSSLERIVETARSETDLHVELSVDGADFSSVDPVAKTALVYAAREAVTNVRKHADATHIDIEIERSAQGVVVSVSDDGVGVRSSEGLGLVTTRERLEALGGTLKISSGRGTVFRATIPAGSAQP